MWHTVQRNFGKLKKSDSGCMISFSYGGGNPVIHPSFNGSDASALKGLMVLAEAPIQISQIFLEILILEIFLKTFLAAVFLEADQGVEEQEEAQIYSMI